MNAQHMIALKRNVDTINLRGRRRREAKKSRRIEVRQERKKSKRNLVPQNVTVYQVLERIRMTLAKNAPAWVALDPSVSDPGAQQCFQQAEGNLRAHVAGHRKDSIIINLMIVKSFVVSVEIFISSLG